MRSFDIIKTVRVTEKGSFQADKFNQYTLVADRRANQIQIRKAIEELFKVKVLRVNALNVPGKQRRLRTPQEGKSPDWKKVVVTLVAGDKITLT